MAENETTDAPTMPTGQWCPGGLLSVHAYNYEHDECIWCGPNKLAFKPGRWVSLGDGLDAWSAAPVPHPAATDPSDGGGGRG